MSLPAISLAKDIEYRNRRLLDLAHLLQECTILLPGICMGFSEHGCEPAHANNWRPVYGKGGARKAHDCFFAAGCHPCHAELDQGRRFNADEKFEYWSRAHDRTLLTLFRRGLLKVAA